MIELVVLVWVLVMATLWFARYLFDEAMAAYRGQTSPRVARREAREKLARDWGVPTVGQAVSGRLARWIGEPPERRWAANLRALLAELVDDAVAEARVRHHRNRLQRARRAAGWRVRTGGGVPTPPPPPDPPPADPDDDVLDTYPCGGGCGRAHVTEPGERCDTCATPEPAPAAAPVTDPPPPSGGGDTTGRTDPMTQSATHDINGDVGDPTTALEFSASCRGFNDGIVGELDILDGILHDKQVGTAPIGEVRVMVDAARTYSASNERSEKEYAEHVIIQADLAADADLSNTVRRTYLDGNGGDARTTARRAATGTLTIRAADCDAPAAAARLMDLVAEAYAGLRVHVEQAKDRHIQQRVSGKPIEFLDAQLEHATLIAGQAQKSAATFRRHIQRRDDTVGKNDAVRGTQQGRWLDTARA